MTTRDDPRLRLDQRLLDEGGAVRTPLQPVWPGAPATPPTQRELVVLVHGFNNDRAEAAEAYAGLRRQQRALLGPDHFAAFDDALAGDFWPGDADWGAFDGLDFLVYPQAVLVARDAVALPLARYLQSRRDVQRLHFVAHSLGCRVVLETLAELARSGGPPVGRVCLMAAAVPVAMVSPGGRLAAGLAQAQDILVLYSPDDSVLSAAFPPGQTLAGAGEGFFPEAVGHAGHLPADVRREQIAGAGHGDYWGHQDNAASRQAAAAVRAFLNFGATAPRQLAAHTGVAPRAVARPREVAGVR